MPTTVHITDQGNQTISGIKTFDVFPIVSGNKLITGVDLSSYLTSSTASSTYSTITNLALTGSTLVGSITSLSGLFTGYTGALDATFASDTQLYTTGSTLDSKINSLSGNLTSTYATITNLATTGSTLDTKINNLSGYINSSSSNIVYTTGNQSINGFKTFAGNIALSYISGSLTNNASIEFGDDDNITISAGNQVYINSPYIQTLPANLGATVLFGDYNQYSPLQFVNIHGGNLLVDHTGIFLSGIDLKNSKLNNASNVIYNTGNQTISGNKSFYGDILLSGSNNRIGKTHYIETNDDHVFIKDQYNDIILSSEEYILFYDQVQSVQWAGRILSDSLGQNALDWENRNLINKNGTPVLYWTGDNIGIGTNNPSEKLQVVGNILGNNLVYNTGNQTISGNKNFYGDILLSGVNTRIGQYHYIDVNDSFVRIKYENGINALDTEENNLRSNDGVESLSWGSRLLTDSTSYVSIHWEEKYLANNLGMPLLTWTGDNIGIGTNIPTEKLQVDGNIRINGGGGLYIFDQPNASDNRMVWQDSELLFELDFDNVNNSFKQAGFLFNSGPLGETALYTFIGAGTQPTYLNIPSGRNGYIAVDSDLVATGSNLNNKINNVSGYINSSGSNIVFTTGNQTISGNKTFNNTITIRTISGTSSSSDSLNLIAASNPLSVGGDINLTAGTGTIFGFSQQGSINLNGQININNNSSLIGRSINIYKTGSALGFPTAVSALTIDENNISLNTLTAPNRGFGLLISGVAVTPALYVDRINNQIINGLKTFTSGIDIYSGASPQILRIFNSTGTNSGEFALIGWRNNQFVIGSQQSQNGILRDVVITGNNININGSGALNIFDNTNIVGNLTISGNTTITGHLSAASKSFLIDHPTQIGKKLQYGSLEGPEHGVFLRGKTNENIINLPNYWPSLVDENSISVNLTPISAANNIYVVDYNNSRITTNGNNGNYYFYTVYGERKDIPKLTVEF